MQLRDHIACGLAMSSPSVAITGFRSSAQTLSSTQTSSDTAYIARHVQIKSGIPIPVPALTINRLYGSGLQSIVFGFVPASQVPVSLNELRIVVNIRLLNVWIRNPLIQISKQRVHAFLVRN